MKSTNDSIIFGIPYFEGFLYHTGEIQELKINSVIVKYSTEVETHRGYEKITHFTEIPNFWYNTEK